MNNWFIALFIIVQIGVAGCELHSPASNDDDGYARSDRSASMVSADTAQANTGFALELFSELIGEKSGSNIFISPLSVSIALAMAMNGASPDNYDEICRVLGFDDSDPGFINEQFRSIIESSLFMDRDVTLYLADSLWARQEFAPRIYDEFMNNLSDYFFAEAYTLDFGDSRAADTINNWVNGHTGGYIDDLIGEIKEETVMYLINAIYFSGTWTTAFDAGMTHAGSFLKSDGTQAECEFMGFPESQNFKYYENYDYESVRLPYGRGKAAMYAFAPKNKTLQEFVEEMKTTGLDVMIGRMHETEIPVLFPRFSCEYEKSLVEVLKALGVNRAFIPGGFMNLASGGEGILITGVAHKAYIEVTENGTEAAAATSIEFGETSVPMGFDGDRPFVYIVRDDRSGTVLFIGTLEDPSI